MQNRCYSLAVSGHDETSYLYLMKDFASVTAQRPEAGVLKRVRSIVKISKHCNFPTPTILIRAVSNCQNIRLYGRHYE